MSALRTDVLRLDENFAFRTTVHAAPLASPNMPVVVSSREGIILPILEYLTNCRTYERNEIGTLEDSAYILRDWFRYLALRGRLWTSADDALLEEWRTLQETAFSRNGAGNRIGKRRIQTKINVVFDFYQEMKRRRYPNANPPWSITARRSNKEGDHDRELGPTVRYPRLPRRRSRPTPSDEEAQRVLDQTLGSANGHTGAIHWMCARWMYVCGLRRMGVGSLTDAIFAEALRKEGISLPGGHHSIAAMASDWDSRDELVAALRQLERSGREEVFILVTEKFGDERQVGVPIGFFIENLEFIWEQRAALVRAKQIRNPNYVAPDYLWISWKTGKALLRKSISWAVHRAFKLGKVPGSPHRLRARYCETVVLDELFRQRALYGRYWEPQSVLFVAAQRMGHSMMKSLAPYLDKLLKKPGFGKEHLIVLDDPRIAKDLRTLAKLLKTGGAIQRRFNAWLNRELAA